MTGSRIIERLARLPRSQRLMVYGLIYIVLVAAYVFGMYLPKGEELGTLQVDKAELVRQRDMVEQRVQNKGKFETELQQLMADLKQALKELPNDREIPNLLKAISTTGKKVGLEVKKFQPLSEVQREFVAEVPVALQVEGSYHEVAMFFDRLAKMNRIVYVQDIEMGNPVERSGKVYLNVTGRAVTFRFLSEDEKQSTEKGKKGARRGRSGGGR